MLKHMMRVLTSGRPRRAAKQAGAVASASWLRHGDANDCEGFLKGREVEAQQSPDAVVHDPVLLRYKCDLATKVAAARHQAQLAQQRCQEAALAAAICASQHHQSASASIQCEVTQHCSAHCNQENVLQS